MTAYDAELYDLIHRGNDGDLKFYLDGCQEAISVLELGCGSGRISLELLRLGKRVFGLDNNPKMLTSLEQHAKLLPVNVKQQLCLVPGDMSAFNLKERFDRVIIPYNGLLCLLDEAAVISCFRAVVGHLKEDGLLLFDIYHVEEPDDVSSFNDVQEDFEPLVSIETPRGCVDVFERHIPNWDLRRFDVSYLYHIKTNKKIYEQEQIIRQRCIYPHEISSLLAKAGLQQRSVLRNFCEHESDEETQQIAITASPLPG